jgi:hypothetical protein
MVFFIYYAKGPETASKRLLSTIKTIRDHLRRKRVEIKHIKREVAKKLSFVHFYL